jgi:uncharacterized protein YjiS (DUF1127 family)
MMAHVAKDGMTFLMPGAARTGAVAQRRRGGVVRKIAGAVQWLIEMPRRRAVLETLSSLSDHELADIGLTRADLPRVFDPAFAASRSAARRAGC